MRVINYTNGMRWKRWKFYEVDGQKRSEIQLIFITTHLVFMKDIDLKSSSTSQNM